jgi:hypothetical protein
LFLPQSLPEFSDLSNWSASVNDPSQSITNQGTVYLTGYSPQSEASPRIGGFSVDLAQNTRYENNTFALDILGYSDVDTLKVLAYNTAAGILTITLVDTYDNAFVFTYTLEDNTGYQVLSAPFPANTLFNNTIKTVRIATNNTASVTIDAIKASVTQELTSEDYLISKSVLSTPIAKIYGTPLDVEYYVQIL